MERVVVAELGLLVQATAGGKEVAVSMAVQSFIDCESLADTPHLQEEVPYRVPPHEHTANQHCEVHRRVPANRVKHQHKLLGEVGLWHSRTVADEF